MKYPINAVHQIEMTSHCNLRCRYCPSPHLPRAKMHMERETYGLALDWAAHFVKRGTQHELNVAGIGESTMHPNFVEFLGLARGAVGFRCLLTFTTNGLLITEDLVKAILPHKPAVFVSLHRPEKAGPAVELLRGYGLLAGVSADPSVSAINWAGQVNWHVSAPKRECFWVKQGRVFVLADGRVSRCCMDATGKGVFATVHDKLDEHMTSPWDLCRSCDQDLNIPGHDQRTVHEAAHA